MKQVEPHIPPEAMEKWREAIRRGDNQALGLLIDELCEPVKEKHDAETK